MPKLPPPEIRQHVVELLVDLNIDHDRRPDLWTHRDGEPVTPNEAALVMSATVPELDAAVTLFSLRMIEAETKAHATERIAAILRPHFKRHPECRIVADIRPYLTPAEQEEVDRLVPLAFDEE